MKMVQIKIVYFAILLVAFSLSILMFPTCLHMIAHYGRQLEVVFHECVLGSECARLIGI